MMTIGPNTIDVPVPSGFHALLEETMTPVMVYQLTCIWVYFAYSWGLPLFWLVSNLTVNAYTVFAVTLPQRKKIGEMAKNDTDVAVMRHGRWEVRHASEIVPGDIVALFSGQEATCDVVVIQGTDNFLHLVKTKAA